MSIRLKMMNAAERAEKSLGDSADRVRFFLYSQINSDGGFKGRTDASDLYYTVFGIEALLALHADVPVKKILNYLRQFEDIESLDLVHLACLVRCRTGLSADPFSKDTIDKILQLAEKYYAQQNSIYSCFFTIGLYQDLNIELPRRSTVINRIELLRTADGAYANDTAIKIGSTPATAAAITLLSSLNAPVTHESADWLLHRCLPEGGFAAMPMAPIPDLLSTAVAIHALSQVNAEINSIKDKCLKFVNRLWSDNGGFRGIEAEQTIDCEYTYYGLLALGHLAQ
ncbi:MAG: hypothetical protein E4H40_03740 [Candidatus Brocadiia bacterium]|nr:MAG: hypothetical protein E4H40_03740 [Candidatus Brocadiia bacterium]